MGTGGKRSHLLVAAGSNSGGQLGLGHTDDVHRFTPSLCLQSSHQQSFPPPGSQILSLSSGANHTAVIVGSSHDRTEFWFAGHRSEGQCGELDTSGANSGATTMVFFTLIEIQAICKQANLTGNGWAPKSVACGWASTFLVLEDEKGERDDAILALGRSNAFGELGIGQVPTSASRLDQICHQIDLSMDRSQTDGRLVIHSIAAGLRHALVHYSIGKTKHFICGWGAARHGELSPRCIYTSMGSGTGEDVAEIHVENVFAKVQWHPMTILQWEAQDGISSVQLACGKQHSVILLLRRNQANQTITRALWVAGAPQLIEQVQDRTRHLDPKLIGCCWNGITLANSDTNQLWSAGSNRHGQIANGEWTATGEGLVRFPEGIAIQSFACGSEHLVACSASEAKEREASSGSTSSKQSESHQRKTAWAWGWNEHGTLGCGDDLDRAQPTMVEQMDTYEVQDVFAGCGTSFLQLVDVSM